MGLTDDFEMGASFSYSLEEIFIGVKYNFYKSETSSFSLLSDVSFPAGNIFAPDTLNDEESQSSIFLVPNFHQPFYFFPNLFKYFFIADFAV